MDEEEIQKYRPYSTSSVFSQMSLVGKQMLIVILL